MDMPKVIVFDLFETLIHDIQFTFSDGMEYLYRHILTKGTDREEFLNYVNVYWKHIYDLRAKDNSEVAFEDELIDLKRKYGFRVNNSILDIQYTCLVKMNQITLFKDTIPTLTSLKRSETPLYLLSNAIFKKNVMTPYINHFHLEPYFNETFFSADYGVRKPHPAFFQAVFNSIHTTFPDIPKQQILFVGDNYTADVLGSHAFGFTPVYLNRLHLPNSNPNHFLEIQSLTELIPLI